MAQIMITLESETEAIAVLELLRTMKGKIDSAAPENPAPDSEDTVSEKKTALSKKTAAKEKKSPVPKEEPAAEDETPAISLSDVRAVALKLSKAGKQKQLKEIFAKYNAEKLSDIDSENYESLMTDLEAEANG